MTPILERRTDEGSDYYLGVERVRLLAKAIKEDHFEAHPGSAGVQNHGVSMGIQRVIHAIETLQGKLRGEFNDEP